MASEKTLSVNIYNKSIDALLEEFNSDPKKGLKSSEIENRFIKYGYNELPKIKKSIWKIYLAPIFNFLIVILLITGVIVIILGSPESTIITFTVVVINSSTAIVQQFRAQKALEALRKISALKAIVIRDGWQGEILTRDVVPGDIVVLNQGSKIPADGRVIDSMNLTINEAPLTGESEPVEKNNKILDTENIPIQNQTNMVFMGTYIDTGRATILITGTGINTEIGKISTQLNEMGAIEDIPLTRKLNKLGYILGVVVIINLIVLIMYKFSILIINNQFYGDFISKALISSILRAMNIMPINLPLLTTLVLVTGVLNMAKNGVIIKNLSAIESLGRVSVISSDKTGTITKNEMTVEKFWINGVEYTVTGSGYELNGEIQKDGKNVDLKANPTFQKFIDSIVINNNSKIVIEVVKVKVQDVREKSIRKALGSPTEASLLVLAEKAGFNIESIKNKYNIVKEYSFSSEFKRMTTVCNSFEEKFKLFAYCKGAPERMLDISSKIEIKEKIRTFKKDLKQKVLNLIQARANQGYRTLAVSYKTLMEFDDPKRGDIEEDLIFLGFVSIMDPPRVGVKEAVEECKSADIKVVMVTGDHPSTAKTIATEMGIYKPGDIVVEGKDIKSLNEEDFNKVSVFARVAPSDKEVIISKFQHQDKVVAMTGDGINDALALKMANAGIAMGITGTDVAKEIADMVISDDNFTSIKEGVKIGRGLFSKIRTIIYFFICLNIMEAVIFFGYEFVPTFVLFRSEWQHIYIFGVVHSLPSLALVIDKHPKDIMKEPPKNDEELLNNNLWVMLLLQVLLMGLGIVLVIQLTLAGIIPLNGWNTNEFYTLSYIPKDTSEKELVAMKARTMFITTLYIVETMFIWTFRRPNQSIVKTIKNEDFSRMLFVICAITLSLHVLVICFSYYFNNAVNNLLGLNFQLNFMFLSATDWLICIIFALPGIMGIELFKYYARKKKIIF